MILFEIFIFGSTFSSCMSLRLVLNEPNIKKMKELLLKVGFDDLAKNWPAYLRHLSEIGAHNLNSVEKTLKLSKKLPSNAELGIYVDRGLPCIGASVHIDKLPQKVTLDELLLRDNPENWGNPKPEMTVTRVPVRFYSDLPSFDASIDLGYVKYVNPRERSVFVTRPLDL